MILNTKHNNKTEFIEDNICELLDLGVSEVTAKLLLNEIWQYGQDQYDEGFSKNDLSYLEDDLEMY